MLFTGKGDDGTTKLFGACPGARIAKTSQIFFALGSLDELNSFLGICKVKAKGVALDSLNLAETIDFLQQDLFIVQAELAGANYTIAKEKVTNLEKVIKEIEDQLPEIKSFFIPGSSELASLLDYARALSRRVERSVLDALNSDHKIGEETKAYLNRLSSILYALARLVNHKLGKVEAKPSYK
ncbi:ATP:cob(I)alamin adenosyltransferase [bacterium]|nr:ATP:cob(I)alamin adenosyltransferase [bacterium]|tara:strand:+ start:162 stop:710 length:549 start_codon:yes stop_codon:yes gene_type:complete